MPDRCGKPGAIGAAPAGQGVVEGGLIPYLPAAAEKRKQNFANRRSADPEAKCYLPGIPRATYLPYPFQIVQSNKDILFVYEYATANRQVNMGKPREAGADSWMGMSNGHWEGDTLVVDVTGLNGKAWFDRAGDFSSDGLHVLERYTLTDRDHIAYEATMEDPKDLRAALENPFDALPACRKGFPVAGIQMYTVRRGTAVRRSSASRPESERGVLMRYRYRLILVQFLHLPRRQWRFPPSPSPKRQRHPRPGNSP